MTMARSLGGAVSQLQFQTFFDKNRADFLFGTDKKYRLLLPHTQTASSSSAHEHSPKHRPQATHAKHHLQSHARPDNGVARERASVSPILWAQHEEQTQYFGSEHDDMSSPRRRLAAISVPVTPADASARARDNLSQEAHGSWTPQLHGQMGFIPVVLHTPRDMSVTAAAHSNRKRDKASSPKELKSGRDAVRLQQYLSWLRSVLPSEDCEALGSDGEGLCNGLLLFKLIKLLGAPADRLQSLHLQMDQGVRTRRLWLRNMEAIGNCVIACSSSICALEPEAAVDGDPGALVALLRLIVQTFVIKKISKTRVVEWCAAHLQSLNATLHPQSVQFPYSNATLQQDFGDGLLLSLLLQKCIPVSEEPVRSEAMLLLQESSLHSSCYSNRNLALALIVTLGVQPYFNMQQLELKPIEHNFLWLQLNAVYLAFSNSLPAPHRVSVAEPKPFHAADGRDMKGVGHLKEHDSQLKVAIQEKRALGVKTTELEQSVQRLHSMQRTLRVLNRFDTFLKQT